MPRGMSIAPRHSGRRCDVPEELKNSFFGSLAHHTENDSMARPQISVFDEEGNLTARQVGVHTFHFRRAALFYYVRSLNWVTLLSLSISFYLLIVGIVSLMYYVWGNMCGASDSVNAIGAIYFTVVSLAANGGYLGEDADTMANPSDMCYRGRTFIVMACSYVNILFVGIVAALVVSKAESTSKLGNRIVFSTYCALAPVPGRLDQWKLSFRIANVENMKPLANGKLRLFCLSTQPMSEYKREQREQRKLVHYLRRARKATSSADLAGSSGVAVAERLTNDLLRRKRLAALEPSGSGGRLAASKAAAAAAGREAANTNATSVAGMASPTAEGAGEELANTSFAPQDPMVKMLLEFKRQKRKERTAQEAKRLGRKAKKGTPEPQTTSTSADRGRRRERAADESLSHDDSAHGTTAVVVSHTSSATGWRSPSSSTSSESSDGVKSDRTDSFMSERPAFSPVSGSPSQGVPSYGTLSHGDAALNARSAMAAGVGRGKNYLHDNDEHEWEDMLPKDDDDQWERVFITSQELSWTCAGESYLDSGASGQLGLWYPAAIIHHIDERSPLFRFMDVQRIGAGLLEEMMLGADMAAEVRRQKSQQTQRGHGSKKAHAPSKRFQLVAVFEATEIETGATITAKHTYDTSEIIANSKFSNKLTRMHKKTKEVWLDYHYFNDMLPLLATDSSTTDSEQ